MVDLAVPGKGLESMVLRVFFNQNNSDFWWFFFYSALLFTSVAGILTATQRDCKQNAEIKPFVITEFKTVMYNYAD